MLTRDEYRRVRLIDAAFVAGWFVVLVTLMLLWGNIPWLVRIIGGLIVLVLWVVRPETPGKLFESYNRYQEKWRSESPDAES
jgi:fatty acid desaturase